jgi:hypothetical protein
MQLSYYLNPVHLPYGRGFYIAEPDSKFVQALCLYITGGYSMPSILGTV